MSEQTSGRHLKRPADEPAGGPEQKRAARPVSTARTAPPARPAGAAQTPPVRPTGTARTAPPSRPAGTVQAAPAARPVRTGNVSYAGGSDRPPRPEETARTDERRVRPLYDVAIRWIVLAVLFVCMAAFVMVLVRTQMLTGKFLLLIGGLLLVLFILMAVFMLAFGKRHLPWVAIVVSLLLSAVMAVGSYMGLEGVETLHDITTKTYNTSHIGVYVREDDPAQSLGDMREYVFGIMETMGRQSVDDAISQINEQMQTTIQTASFGNPTALVDALVGQQVGAAILDTSYIDGLSELEQYQQAVAGMREITNMHVTVPTVPVKEQETVEEPEEQNTFTVLISGIDSRKGLVSSSLCDVNILVTVNTDTRQVMLVSTPRDYCVPFANGEATDKLTHAGWYGEEVLMQTVANIYDIDIDYYFRVSFNGFKSIVDALGGITVNSTFEFTTFNEGIHFNAGENYLNGEQALAFARERRSFADGDEQRGRNQMALIRGIAKKIMSPEILTRYSSVLNALEGCFETTVPYDLIASLVRRQLDEGGDWDIVSYSVSGEGTRQVSPMLGTEVYVMIPDQETIETAKDYMAQVRNGVILDAPGDTVGT